MTYEFRNTLDFKFGTLSVAASVSDTTISSADFTSLATGYSTGNYFPIILLDPTTKTHEKVWLVGHASSSTDITVVRGREGTAAQAWPSGTQWVSGPTIRDTLFPSNSTSLPTDPHVGMRGIFMDKFETWDRTYLQGWKGCVKAVGADMGRAADATTSHPTGRVPEMRMWTATGTTDASGILAATIPNGGFSTRLISAVATRYDVQSAFVPTISASSTKTVINILASNTGTGAVGSSLISVCLMAIGY